MSNLFLPAFERRDKEAELIGKMLMAYGELEFSLASCVGYVLGEGTAGFRVLFRLRSETQRIDVADAILRPQIKKFGLLGDYADALGAIRLCKAIRNQYAHCHWLPDDNPDTLRFSHFETPAKSVEDDAKLQTHETDLALLTQQSEYFGYTFDQWFYVEEQLKTHLGEPSNENGPYPKPKKQPRVNLYIDQLQ